MIAFLRGLLTHVLLIVLVVVLGFLTGVLAAYLWPPRPPQPALVPLPFRACVARAAAS